MQWTELQHGYTNLWAKAKPRARAYAKAVAVALRLTKNEARYEAVGKSLGIPWWFIAIVHELESGGDFATHLHNGDPLTARTVHVPAGRPVLGAPPFTWETSARDALVLEHMDTVTDWSIPHALYLWEGYNGYGYFKHNVNSPYLWSGTNLYSKGKFTADGKYSPTTVSGQLGAAVILQALLNNGLTLQSSAAT